MLELKDVRFKLDPDMHTALTVLSDVESQDIVECEIKRRIHVAKVVASKLERAGIAGKLGEY